MTDNTVYLTSLPLVTGFEVIKCQYVVRPTTRESTHTEKSRHAALSFLEALRKAEGVEARRHREYKRKESSFSTSCPHRFVGACRYQLKDRLGSVVKGRKSPCRGAKHVRRCTSSFAISFDALQPPPLLFSFWRLSCYCLGR